MSGPPPPEPSTGRWLPTIMWGIFLWSVVLAVGVWFRWPDRYRGWRSGIVILAAILFLAAWNLLLRRREAE